MAHPLFEKHQTLLQRAVEAVRSRTYWSAYSENPRTYGENAIEEAEGRVENLEEFLSAVAEPERDRFDAFLAEARIGVFVCQCGGRISEVLEMDRLVEHYRGKMAEKGFTMEIDAARERASFDL